MTLVIVSSGHISSGTVGAGDSVVVQPDGTGRFLIVSGGGTDIVYASGIVSNTTLDSGGLEQNHGSSIGTFINASGVDWVTSGGVAINTIVESGGTLVLFPGGMQTGTTLDGGAIVSAGVVFEGVSGPGSFVDTPIASGVVLPVGATEFVLPGGTALSNTLGSYADQTILAGGVASDTVNSGGVDGIGGTTYAATIEIGQEEVNAGGSAVGTTLDAGGSQLVFSGGTVSNVTLSGGTEIVSSGATIEGSAVFAPVDGGRIVISALQDFRAVVDGFASGDTISLFGVDESGIGILGPGNVMTVSSGGTSATLTFDPLQNFAGETLVLTPETTPITPFGGGTSTQITLAPACFAAGTRIATPTGEVAVEALSVGDLVRIRGGAAPVVWIGHRHVDCRRHPAPNSVWPVRIAPHAFAPNRPSRPLYLSPDHAVFADGVLVPIRCLIDGAGIVHEARDTVSYWHVELARHDALLAEGLPCESFLDTGNRSAFANGGPAIQAHPDFARRLWDAEGCAPLVVAGPEVEALRARLQMRAGDPESGAAAA